MHDKHLLALAFVLAPTLTLAAGVATPLLSIAT